MKINIHDKFTSWRQFVDLVKWIYRYLDSYNLEVRNLTVYIATENKETKKISTLYVKSKENDEDVEEIGLDIGYFEWEGHDGNAMVIKKRRESELLNQSLYKMEREHQQALQRAAEREAKDLELSKVFEKEYLPIRSLTKKTGIMRSDFKSLKEIERRGYDWKRIKKAIDEDKCYKDYRWKSLNKNRGDTK